MGKSSKKPRKKKLDPRQIPLGDEKRVKKEEKDWGFEEILRTKRRGR